jgi:hypothetical protein
MSEEGIPATDRLEPCHTVRGNDFFGGDTPNREPKNLDSGSRCVTGCADHQTASFCGLDDLPHDNGTLSRRGDRLMPEVLTGLIDEAHADRAIANLNDGFSDSLTGRQAVQDKRCSVRPWRRWRRDGQWVGTCNTGAVMKGDSERSVRRRVSNGTGSHSSEISGTRCGQASALRLATKMQRRL